jgi:hypothetical protein
MPCYKALEDSPRREFFGSFETKNHFSLSFSHKPKPVSFNWSAYRFTESRAFDLTKIL